LPTEHRGRYFSRVQAKVAYADLYGNTEKSILGIEFTEGAMVGYWFPYIMTILILVASENKFPKTIGATILETASEMFLTKTP